MRTQGGFTFIELIIYVAIAGALSVTFIYFTLAVSSSRATAYSSSEVQANARMGIGYIRTKIKNSSGASVVGGSLVLTTQTTPITIDVSAGRLRTTQNGISSFVTSDETNISNILFTDLTPTGADRENIRMSMTIEFRAAASSDYSYTYTVDSAAGTRQ
jgi:Tfp pilus assembly protein PilE